MSQLDTIVERSQKVILENYGRYPIAMIRGEGSLLWDSSGTRYLDFFVGFGAGGIGGHCHPQISEAIRAQASRVLSHGNLFTNEPQTLLAEKLVEHAFAGKVFFCHSGAEANETALKLMRLAADEHAHKIICFEHSFHGRTMGGLSLTPSSFQKGFEPMLPGAVRLPFGDLEAVKNSIDEETAGIILEVIQGEGGINEASPEFVRGLRALCDEHQILLVVDEVWTSPARTGKWFAHQYYDIVPDAMTLGKALGGGVPLAACLVSSRWSDVLGPGTHSCTLGGNPLCTAAGLATLELVEEAQLVSRARKKGDDIIQTLRDARIPCIKEIRGKGAFIGIELSEDIAASEVAKKCLEKGLLIASAKNNVIRLAPALTIEEDILEEGLSILFEVLATTQSDTK